MGSGVSKEDVWTKVEEMKTKFPDNRCVKYLSKEYFEGLSEDDQKTFYKCIKTGLDNEESGLGCYAMKPTDYETFGAFFDKVIGDYHKGDPAFSGSHETSWDTSKIGEGGVIDFKTLGLENELSMRVRVGRNLVGYNLPGMMDQAERVKFEVQMLAGFEKLKETFGGDVYSLSPNHGEGVTNPNLISPEKYDELVKSHVMFKDMDADPYLKSAGIASDWPFGRGCWQSADKQCIVWFGEEDQLRIMCMKKGFLLNEVFDTLKKLLEAIESIEGIEFAKSTRFGYVTSCPSNLGTGMRASVHVALPKLCSDGTDVKAKAVCKPLGLSVRGTGGEHTPIGADGTVDISPSNRLFITEADIVNKLYDGLKALLAEEKAAGDAAPAPA